MSRGRLTSEDLLLMFISTLALLMPLVSVLAVVVMAKLIGWFV